MNDLGTMSMVGRIEVVAVKSPSAALAHIGGEDWRALGWHAPIDAARAEEVFETLMGDDVPSRKSFIQQNADDVRFLDI